MTESVGQVPKLTLRKKRTPKTSRKKARSVKPLKAWAIVIDGVIQNHQLTDSSPVALYRRKKDAEIWYDGEYAVRVTITESRK